MGTKTQKLSNIVDQVVEWQSVFTGDGSTGLTAVAGRGYFIDTTSSAVTVTLPASPKIGDTIIINDYAGTFGTNGITLSRNGSNINGTAADGGLFTNSQTATLVYLDSTRGWQTIANAAPETVGAAYIAATGGTVTTSGDYKIHTFTGDGCFVVSNGGNPLGSSSVDYLVVAGGASGGSAFNLETGKVGGGGAGGYRESSGAASGCYSASPLGACVAALPVSASTYPVTVGGGGASNPSTTQGIGNNGSNSVFSTITSTGGGGGGAAPGDVGQAGGSGGGGSYSCSVTKGAGNTPPVSPPQGNPGGQGLPGVPYAAGGGGGATVAGTDATNPASGPGGAGATTSISGSPTAYAGGGGGSGKSFAPTPATAGSGGTGGGGAGGCRTGPTTSTPGVSGTANTGGGGGGGQGASPSIPGGSVAGAGGKGIVIIRYKFQN